MSRKHLFPIVVLLAAALVAGLLAVSRTVALGRPANAATASDPAIAFRLKKLDRFEQSLRRQLAHATATTRDRHHRVPARSLGDLRTVARLRERPRGGGP